MKRVLSIFSVTILLLSLLTPSVFSIDIEAEWEDTELSAVGFDYPQYLNDNKDRSYADSEGGATGNITIARSDGIAHIYVIFDKIYGQWSLTDNDTGKTVTVGKDSFLHEYINTEELFGNTPRSLNLTFENNAYIAEVYGFSKGELPEWVQIWSPPLEKADILLLSSHSDDEQLFFAGVLPYYAGEVGADVQVVYLISHFDTHERPHEQLNGLWAVGVKNYPVISEFPDLYSESLDSAISVFEKQGYTYEDFTSYIVENIRRFKPQVLITHDIEGEYSHGTHIYCTDVVMNSLEKTAEESFCPESAEKWGTWDVPKTYLHLYSENKITMNWDIPLKAFDGKTAFEMTVIGFSYHKSQHWTWFNDWIHGKEGAPVTKATDIKTYSPCHYGLYRTTVGPDIAGGDFLENITLYKDQTPPETDPPETLPATNNTAEIEKPIESDNAEKNENKSEKRPEILIGILLGTVVIIFLIFTKPKKNKRR